MLVNTEWRNTFRPIPSNSIIHFSSSWFRRWRWTFGWMIPLLLWYFGHACQTLSLHISIMFFIMTILLFFKQIGMVLSRSDLRSRWVLRQVRSPRMLPSFVLPGWFAVSRWTWDDDWSHSDPLFLRLLRFTRSWKSVWILSRFYTMWNNEPLTITSVILVPRGELVSRA